MLLGSLSSYDNIAVAVAAPASGNEEVLKYWEELLGKVKKSLGGELPSNLCIAGKVCISKKY